MAHLLLSGATELASIRVSTLLKSIPCLIQSNPRLFFAFIQRRFKKRPAPAIARGETSAISGAFGSRLERLVVAPGAGRYRFRLKRSTSS
jgi:hypothetical protein